MARITTRLQGDLFASSCEALVNTVNCVGVMGKGVALGFKERYPAYFRDYAARCDKEQIMLGSPYLFRRLTPPHIVSFPTKDHWRSATRWSDVSAGLEHLVAESPKWNLQSIAFPPLGCGNGGLAWEVVAPTMVKALQRVDAAIELYAPYWIPYDDLNHATDQSRLVSREEGTGNRRTSEVDAWYFVATAVEQILARHSRQRIGRDVVVHWAQDVLSETDGSISQGRSQPASGLVNIKKGLRALVNNGLVAEHGSGQSATLALGPAYSLASGILRTVQPEVEARVREHLESKSLA